MGSKTDMAGRRSQNGMDLPEAKPEESEKAPLISINKLLLLKY